jgi:hypothetical protein
MKVTAGKLGLWLCGAAAAAGALYVAVWMMVAAQVRTLSDEWIASQRREGWSIAAGPVTVHGFPRWPQVTLTAVQVTAPLGDGGWTWTAERATVVPAALDLTRLTILAPGTQTVALPGQPTWTVSSYRAVLEIAVDDSGKWQRGDLTFADLEVRDAEAIPLFGAARFNASLALADGPRGPELPFAAFSGSVDTLRLALAIRPFTRTVTTARLDADLVGAVAPGRLSDALDAWRDGGGTLEVRRFLVDWPPLTIAGNGTLALDNDLQPIAAFSTQISGFSETIDVLEADGMMDADDAATANVVLGLMAQAPPDGGPAQLNIPVSVQDRQLSVGPFPLLNLPAIEWDE